jgi:hypothetical protein
LKTTSQQLGGDDGPLRELIISARPDVELELGFERAVWRRIEALELHEESWLDRLAAWVLRPRVAATALAALILLGSGLGALQGVQTGEAAALNRYLGSVSPMQM